MITSCIFPHPPQPQLRLHEFAQDDVDAAVAAHWDSAADLSKLSVEARKALRGGLLSLRVLRVRAGWWGGEMGAVADCRLWQEHVPGPCCCCACMSGLSSGCWVNRLPQVEGFTPNSLLLGGWKRSIQVPGQCACRSEFNCVVVRQVLPPGLAACLICLACTIAAMYVPGKVRLSRACAPAAPP